MNFFQRDKFFENGKYIHYRGQKFFHPREELEILTQQAEKKDLAIEIGSLCGFGTAVLLRNFQKVICVDPYESGYDDKDGNSMKKRLGIADELWNIRFFDNPSVELRRERSLEAAKAFSKSSIDFCFIDAGHSYDAVKSDIEAWISKIRPGGIISGDDYDWRNDGVKNAVTEIFGNDVHLIQNRIWFHKIA